MSLLQSIESVVPSPIPLSLGPIVAEERSLCGYREGDVIEETIDTFENCDGVEDGKRVTKMGYARLTNGGVRNYDS